MIPTETPPPNDPIRNTFFPNEEKEILSALTRGSYFANRSYGMTPQSYAKLFGWSEELMNQYESAYQTMMANIENENRYKRLIEDLDLIQDENF